MHTPHPNSLDPPQATSCKNHHKMSPPEKNLAYFSHLAPLVTDCFFSKRQSQKGGGGMAQWPPSKYAPEGRMCTMRGSRLFDPTDWKSKNKSLHVLRCSVS